MSSDALAPLRRDHLPADLKPLLDTHQLDGCVAVQARQTIAESHWLLELADDHPFIKGVVGWVDLRDAGVNAQLEELSRHPKFVGVRHVAQDEPDDRFLVGADFMRGIEKLKRHGLTYDLLVFPRQLPAATELVQHFPEQPFVLDHLAKPAVKEGQLEPWRDHLLALAGHPNCFCKVSGLVTEADWNNWQPDNFAPFLEAAVKAFGPQRLMFGSDWPVCTLAGDYSRVFNLAETFTADWSATDRDAFYGKNAAHIYCLQC